MPPDGLSPFMRMFLWHETGAPVDRRDADPFLPANGADEADIVYHEYTHGLSNRLVVDSLGFSTLASHQAGSMGEAWSDWYAMDYLRRPAGLRGRHRDTPGDADSDGNYIGSGGQTLIRTRRSTARSAPPTARTAPRRTPAPAGGLTYGDLGRIDGAPEVHATARSGRRRCGISARALGHDVDRRRSITARDGAVADDPSFLDMRNAILQADTVLQRRRAHDRDLGGVRAPRHGLLRRDDRRRRHAPRRELRDAAGRERAAGLAVRVGHRPPDARPGARRPRRRSPASTPGSPAVPAPTRAAPARTGCGDCPSAPTRT